MKLNIISHICTPGITLGKWKAGTGVSPEAHGPPSLACSGGKKTRDPVSKKGEGKDRHLRCLWLPCAYHGICMFKFTQRMQSKEDYSGPKIYISISIYINAYLYVHIIFQVLMRNISNHKA